jgi:hypothetical protein
MGYPERSAFAEDGQELLAGAVDLAAEGVFRREPLPGLFDEGQGRGDALTPDFNREAVRALRIDKVFV